MKAGSSESPFWQRVRAVFGEALDQPPAERDAWLSSMFRSEPDVLEEVRSLLLRTEATLAVDGQEAGAVPRSAPPAGHPTRLGGFRILSLLGEGGMGAVYEAEQRNPHRRVALKVIRVALASGEMRRRFELEGEVLGRLKHPCIAQVYETGTATLAEGVEVPYLSMEHVAGAVSLNHHVSGAELTLAERLELFCLIADGIEHAHQQGIVHRDLKPDNVLVDGDGHPKVIDFGLARAVGEGSDLISMHTRTGQIMGTPTYMSPEQFAGKPGEVGTASDVYSLGVMLYELVTGELPHELTGLGVLDMARIVRELPARPLSQSGTWVRDDLDTIVAKALEKKPERRYESAAGLAADVRRYLRHEPVHARPMSAIYQARLFVRRHRPLVAAVSVILLVAIAAAVVSLRFAFDAQERSEEAERKSYVASLVSAADAVEEKRFGAARYLLEDTPERLRGWEYLHLSSRLDDSLPSPLPPEWEPMKLELSPDGARAAAFTHQRDHESLLTSIGVWTLFEVGFDGGPWTAGISLPPSLAVAKQIQFSPDGTRLLQVSLDQETVQVWGVETGDLLMPVPVETSARWIGVDWHPSGTRFLVAGDPLLAVHDAVDGSLLASTERPGEDKASQVSAVYSADGRWILERRIDEIHLLDAETLQPVGEAYRPGLSGGTVALMSAPSGPLAALASLDGVIQIVEATEQGVHLVRQLEGVVGYPLGTCWSDDGRRLAVGSGKQELHVWDVTTGKPVAKYPVEGDPQWVALLHESGDLLYSVAGRHAVKPVGRPRTDVLRGHRSYVYPAVFSPDGSVLISGGWGGLDGHSGSLKIRDADTGAKLFQACGDREVPLDVDVSPDGRLAVAAVWAVGVGNRLDILDLVSGEERRIHTTAEKGLPQRVVIHPDGRRVLASFREGSVVMWDLETEEVLWKTDLDPPRKYSGLDKGCVAVSPDGRWIALADEATGIRLVDAGSYEDVRRWDAHTDEIWSLSFSPDNRWLLSPARDQSLGVWDVETGSLVARLVGHSAEVMCAAVSPDGTRIASGGRDGYVRLWDTTHFDNVAQLGGHEDYIYSISWSPDGSTLVTGSGDGTVRKWETRDIAQQFAAIEEREAALPRVEAAVARVLGDPAESGDGFDRLLADPALTERERVLMRQARLVFGRDREVARRAGVVDPDAVPGLARSAPAWYQAPRRVGPLVMDGVLDEADWDRAPWSTAFVDIEGAAEPLPEYETRMRMLWDDEFLYVAARMEEPHLWGTLTEHDSIIYRDNDFEVFLDPEGDGLWYGEVEVNALGTIFDLQLTRAYSRGGRPVIEWTPPELMAGVSLDGTLNDPSDIDTGWSVEIAIPHSALAKHASVPIPPRPGDAWRINFSRVHWQLDVVDGAYVKRPGTPEDNWVWTPQFQINMHAPRQWGFVEFMR